MGLDPSPPPLYTDYTVHADHTLYTFLLFFKFFFDGYCSTVQGLLDWFEVDLGFTELSFSQIDLRVLCVFTVYTSHSVYKSPIGDVYSRHKMI